MYSEKIEMKEYKHVFGHNMSYCCTFYRFDKLDYTLEHCTRIKTKLPVFNVRCQKHVL